MPGLKFFHKPEDYDSFEQILAEGLLRYACRMAAYQLMSNHRHFVLQPTEDGGMNDFLRWGSLDCWREEPERKPCPRFPWPLARSERGADYLFFLVNPVFGDGGPLPSG